MGSNENLLRSAVGLMHGCKTMVITSMSWDITPTTILSSNQETNVISWNDGIEWHVEGISHKLINANAKFEKFKGV